MATQMLASAFHASSISLRVDGAGTQLQTGLRPKPAPHCEEAHIHHVSVTDPNPLRQRCILWRVWKPALVFNTHIIDILLQFRGSEFAVEYRPATWLPTASRSRGRAWWRCAWTGSVSYELGGGEEVHPSTPARSWMTKHGNMTRRPTHMET